MLGQKKLLDSSHVLEVPTIKPDKNQTSEEESMAIIKRRAWKLRLKRIVSTNLIWIIHTVREATGEYKNDK